MNHNCQHTDAEWRDLQEQVAELTRLLGMLGRVYRKLFEEFMQLIEERAA